MTPPEAAQRFGTWLGLLSSQSRFRARGGGRLEARPVGTVDDPCYMLVVDGWLLLSTDGAVTVFRNLEAVEHLLRRFGIDAEVRHSGAPVGPTPDPQCRDCWTVDGGRFCRCPCRN